MALLIIILTLLVTCQGEFEDEIHERSHPLCHAKDVFSCQSGTCIAGDKYCDGVPDCEDGSDEYHCPVSLRKLEISCNDLKAFKCADKIQCIPNVWVCNNYTECNDGSDEWNCTVYEEPSNCKGFLCDNKTRCISKAWMCDAQFDCDDKTDEDVATTCHRERSILYNYGGKEDCENGTARHQCLDDSYCLSAQSMCDGMQDCRDGSDEGKFCDLWHKQCLNFTCPPLAECKPQRSGEPTCLCHTYGTYNKTSKSCENVNACLYARPFCSQKCNYRSGIPECSCDAGYDIGKVNNQCFAPDPEGLLFYSTGSEIRYVTLKTKQHVVVLTGLKQAYGVSYDGSYLYWVETTEGHQAVLRAQIQNVEDTKQVIASLGLEDPADIVFDHYGNNLYITDTEGGIIAACVTDGSICSILPAKTKLPKHITLDQRNGKMYWADYNKRAYIMTARMDGYDSTILIDNLKHVNGLALDAPNGRLYFAEDFIKVMNLETKVIYTFLAERFHVPYSLAVFENSVYWADYATSTLQVADKMLTTKRSVFLELNTTTTNPVYDLQIYHPSLMKNTNDMCGPLHCGICLITSNDSVTCPCPDNMLKDQNNDCQVHPNHPPTYLVVGAGSQFIRIQLDTIGNPEKHITNIDVGKVQAMAYDNQREVVIIYDSQRKTVNSIKLSEFTLGLTSILPCSSPENIVDMEYDPATDTLYILDSGRHVLEAMSLKTNHTAIIHSFGHYEFAISFCLMPNYGKLMVASMDFTGDSHEIIVDILGMDGGHKVTALSRNVVGPKVRLRYSQSRNLVYMSDEGSGKIMEIHPTGIFAGTSTTIFRNVLTTIGSLAATDTQVFWTDRHSTKLYWADVKEPEKKIRRIDLTLLPKNNNLYIQATKVKAKEPVIAACAACEHVCVQSRLWIDEDDQKPANVTCVCAIGYKMVDGSCTPIIYCNENEMYCHRSNECFKKSKKCDRVQDCKFGEDEEGCVDPTTETPWICADGLKLCNGKCIPERFGCYGRNESENTCTDLDFLCTYGDLCVSRSLMCDGHNDCPDGSDESRVTCDTASCYEAEFMCGSGNCVPITWRCDGGEDCEDGSDEVNCDTSHCPEHMFQCRNSTCIDLSKRCDGKFNCPEQDDEENCDTSDFVQVTENEVKCMPWEFACEYDKSICLPKTARCNIKVDCPGGSDENNCDTNCAGDMITCKNENYCIKKSYLCDGSKDCSDGYDESDEACERVNKTRKRPTPADASCSKGYRCDNAQCIEWALVCNNVDDCADQSDEGGLCSKSCNGTCARGCHVSPRGPMCECLPGYAPAFAVPGGCHNVDECRREPCAHSCHDLPGSFVCSCNIGYALRSDRRSCKALQGRLSVLYSRNDSVWSMTSHVHHLQYLDEYSTGINDIAVDVRRGKLYIASSTTGLLLQVDLFDKTATPARLTNIGIPSQVAVDWITGNVFFYESQELDSHIFVCNFDKRECISFMRFPAAAQVTALEVDAANYNLFFCINEGSEALVRSTTLYGSPTKDLASIACSGLAVDSFKRVLYVASEENIVRMKYDGSHLKTIISGSHILRPPHHLALFEDYLYILSGNNLTRCLLFSSRTCTTYTQLPRATGFVVNHDSVQRNDTRNPCADKDCYHICMLGRFGPRCLCYGAETQIRRTCKEDPNIEKPEFEVQSKPHGRIMLVIFVIIVALGLLGIYLYILWKRAQPPGTAGYSVAFRNEAVPLACAEMPEGDIIPAAPQPEQEPAPAAADAPAAESSVSGFEREFIRIKREITERLKPTSSVKDDVSPPVSHSPATESELDEITDNSPSDP